MIQRGYHSTAGRLALALLVVLAGLVGFRQFSHADEAPPAGKPIASVVAIDGNLSVQRAGQARWCDGYVQMPDYAKDRLKTDANSMAALDFNSGGRVGINKGSEIEIVGDGTVQDSGNGYQTVVLKSGTVWARFQKQEKPLRIQTKSALLTVKGTEFVVESSSSADSSAGSSPSPGDASSGIGNATTLSVLEGTVAYTALSDGSPVGQVAEAGPGSQVVIAYKQVPVVKQYQPKELRKSLEDRYPALNNWFVRRILAEAFSRVPYSGLAVSIVMDPNKAAEAIANEALSHVPGGGMIGGMMGGGSNRKKEPDFPSGLTPDQNEQDPSALTFGWKPFRKCEEYLLLLSHDEKMDALDWSSRVKGTSIDYPKSGFALKAGQKYFWRVIGLNKEGKPDGKAAQTFFTVPSSYVPPSQ